MELHFKKEVALRQPALRQPASEQEKKNSTHFAKQFSHIFYISQSIFATNNTIDFSHAVYVCMCMNDVNMYLMCVDVLIFDTCICIYLMYA